MVVMTGSRVRAPQMANFPHRSVVVADSCIGRRCQREPDTCVQESMSASKLHRAAVKRLKEQGKRIRQVGQGADGNPVMKLAPLGRWRGFRPVYALPGCTCRRCENKRAILKEYKRVVAIDTNSQRTPEERRAFGAAGGRAAAENDPAGWRVAVARDCRTEQSWYDAWATRRESDATETSESDEPEEAQ